MPLPTASVAYRDVQAMMARALETAKGVRVKCDSEGKAIQLRQRLYSFRKAERRDAQNMYPRDDPRWGATDYDALRFTLVETEGQWSVVIEKLLDKDQIDAIIEEI